MDVEFDPAKDQANLAKHGVSLALAAEFDFQTAVIEQDDRFPYGEERWYALGFLRGRLFSLTFTETEVGIRAISLRPASRQEHKVYEQESA